MVAELTLRGLVRAKYNSVQAFADDLGWSYSKTYRIVNGVQLPDLEEIRLLCKVLGLTDMSDIGQVFSLG